MTQLIIDILDEGDKSSVLQKLDEFQGRHWIRYSQFSAAGLPGSPMTQQELDSMLDEAENSPSLSVDAFKARLGIV
jgi:hypothetical protein